MKTMTALCLCLSAFSATAQLPAVLVGPFRNPANGHLYYLLEAASWTDSEAQAVNMGGHLVTINNRAENRWVVNTFATLGDGNLPLWIGFTDQRSEGRFYWSSGEPSFYANWSTGEPNNSGGAGYQEDFTYIVEPLSGHPTLLPGKWNDIPPDGAGYGLAIYGVVEIQPSRFLRPRFNHPASVQPGGWPFKR